MRKEVPQETKRNIRDERVRKNKPETEGTEEVRSKVIEYERNDEIWSGLPS